MVARHAFLIANQGVQGSGLTPLAGVSVDVGRYARFLQSEAGGAWRSEEISVLVDQGRDAILADLSRQVHDYTIVVYTGHGDHLPGEGSRAWLSAHEVLFDYDLATYAPRQLLIMDSCRELQDVVLEEGVVKFGGVGAAPSGAYRASCRAFYDYAWVNAPEGRTTMFSCDLNQTAGESRINGGYFSYWLIRSAQAWSQANRRGDSANAGLSVPSAFETARQQVTVRHRPQTPVLEDGRRTAGSSYPFAVG